jgi:hypothetical protein
MNIITAAARRRRRRESGEDKEEIKMFNFSPLVVTNFCLTHSFRHERPSERRMLLKITLMNSHSVCCGNCKKELLFTGCVHTATAAHKKRRRKAGGRKQQQQKVKIIYRSTVINFRTKAFISCERLSVFKGERDMSSSDSGTAEEQEKRKIHNIYFHYKTNFLPLSLSLVPCDFCG